MPFLPIIRIIDRMLGPCFQKIIKHHVFVSTNDVKQQRKGPCQEACTPSSERVDVQAMPAPVAKRRPGHRRNPDAPHLARGPRLCGRSEALDQLDRLRSAVREPLDLRSIMPASSSSTTVEQLPEGEATGSHAEPTM